MNYKEPKKFKNPVKAIREKCIECMGGRGTGQNVSKLISECSSPSCPTYEFRFGKSPYRKPKYSDKQRMEMAERGKRSALIQRALGKTL
jgi:hypothetical protein